MRPSKVFTCLLLLLSGARLEAAKDRSIISGKIDTGTFSKAVRVQLQIYSVSDRFLDSIPLRVDSTPEHAFREEFPKKLTGNDFLLRVDVDQPQDHFSQWPYYSWSRGQSVVLLLKPKSEAYQDWLKAARRADSLEPALKMLDALWDWGLEPGEGFSVTRTKAGLYDRWRELRRQQEYLQEIFDSPEVQGLPQDLVIQYFNIRVHGFTKLIGGRLNSIPQVPKLQELWEALVSDFADEYSSCGLDIVMSLRGAALTSEVIAGQRKAMRTWLGRPGASVRDCGRETRP